MDLDYYNYYKGKKLRSFRIQPTVVRCDKHCITADLFKEKKDDVDTAEDILGCTQHKGECTVEVFN